MTASAKNIKMFYIFRKYSFTFFVEGPWSPYKKCKIFLLFFFHSFYIFLSITADTIKLELIFIIRSKATKVAKRSICLRNKFHFSEVHGSMNIMDHVQSK